MLGTLPQSSLRKFWMLAAAALTDSKWNIMALGNRRKFFPNYFLMCFNKEMLAMARTLNVELMWFFSVLASATDVLGYHSWSWLFCGSLGLLEWLGLCSFSKGNVLICSWRKSIWQDCSQVNIALHLMVQGWGSGVFWMPTGFGTWQLLAVPNGCGMRLDGLPQATNKCLAWVWMPLPSCDLALTKR